jgi:type IX secretion system PorP/SprF family membrane protein
MAQSDVRYPVMFSQFTLVPTTINPALNTSFNKSGVYFLSQFYRPPFNPIIVSTAGVFIQMNKRDSIQQHFIAIDLYNDREGKLLSTNYIFARYAFHIQLSNQLKLLSGVSIGLVNLSIDQTQTGGGISSFAPDMKLGIGLKHQKFYFGISMGQFLKRKLALDYSNLYLPIYSSFIGEYTSRLNYFLKIQPSIALMFYERAINPIQVKTQIAFVFIDKLNFSLGHAYKSGFFVQLFIKEMAINKSKFSMGFTYNSSFYTLLDRGLESFEISLAIVR